MDATEKQENTLLKEIRDALIGIRKDMADDRHRRDSMLHAWRMVEIANDRLAKYGAHPVRGPRDNP